MNKAISKEFSDFFPIKISSISVDSVYDFDLYQNNSGKLRLFRRRNVSISKSDFDNLAEYGHDTLYVPTKQRGKLCDFMIKNLPDIIRDKSMPVESRLAALNETSVNVLDMVLLDPNSKENVAGTVAQSRNHVDFAFQGKSAQQLMSSSNPKTSFPIAHAINVANLSILLALRCNFDDPEKLQELCIGALLHEIGKRIIDKNYYFRQHDNYRISDNRLTKYPTIGKDMLDKMDVVPKGALVPIAEHQERLDGSGFPYGLKDSDISLESRIVAICDYYDTSVHSRPSHKNKTPFQILMDMKHSIGKFDNDIFVEFVYLLGDETVEEADNIPFE